MADDTDRSHKPSFRFTKAGLIKKLWLKSDSSIVKTSEEIGLREKSFSLYRGPNWRKWRSSPWRTTWVNRPIKQ